MSMKINSQVLRDKFNELFSYDDLTRNDIIRLAMYCQQECAKHNLFAGHSKIWVPSLLPKNGVIVRMQDDDDILGLREAYIFANSDYFKRREGISFNKDGFIGFCGWADAANTKPFYVAFIKWLAEMHIVRHLFDRSLSESTVNMVVLDIFNLNYADLSYGMEPPERMIALHERGSA